jgi:hypothetical protein
MDEFEEMEQWLSSEKLGKLKIWGNWIWEIDFPLQWTKIVPINQTFKCPLVKKYKGTLNKVWIMPIPPTEQTVEFFLNHLFEISKLKEIMKERKIQKLVSSC